jgi:hypothetical protein
MPAREWGPIVFAADSTSPVLSRAVQRGTLRRLARGIYTGDTVSAPEAIVRQHLLTIVAHEYPGAVVADRSVPDAGVTADGALFIVHPRRRPVVLSGVAIYPRSGPGPVEGDMPWPDNLWLSSRERALLDNLVFARPKAQVRRTLDQTEFEEWLERLLQDRGTEGLNQLRDRARRIAAELGREKEMKQLDRLMSAALSTRDDVEAVSPAFAARLAGVPYDEERIERFVGLARYLKDTAPAPNPALPVDAGRRRLLPFYEAYFSNFIEGTVFELDEAAKIVFEGVVPSDRPADAHDVLGTYEIVADPAEMRRTPNDPDELEALLLARHAVLMANRPEMNLGHWKTQNNRAGSTVFVAWELVQGTLRRGFEVGGILTDPFARAVFMMFLVAEVHPFTDGNGRIARVMMNAELEAAGEVRIIVPTVYRDNYLSALRGVSFNGNFASLATTLDFARRWTARVDFTNREHAESDLRRTNALRDSAEADQSGVRLILP